VKKKKKTWVIDLGEGVTKVIKGFLDEKRGVVVEKYWIKPTPIGIFSEGIPQKELESKVFVRELLRESHVFDRIILVLNHPQIVVEAFEIPLLDIEEIQKVVYWKMKLIIKDSIAQWRIDFLAKERTEAFEYLGIEDKQLDILVIAIPKEVLIGNMQVVKKRNLKITIIEPQFHSLSRFLDDDHNYLIIEIGVSNTRIYYYVKGLLKTMDQLENQNNNDDRQNLLPIIDCILKKIESPLLMTQWGEKNQILLAGGGSCALGVREYFEEKLNRSVVYITDCLKMTDRIVVNENMDEWDKMLIMPCLGGLLLLEKEKKDDDK
jgi:Tfp pilus assembly PilM family ATPase